MLHVRARQATDSTIGCASKRGQRDAAFHIMYCMWCAASGPVFVLCWPLYPDASWTSALAAASVLVSGGAQFVLVGTRAIHDPLFVKAVGHGPGHERQLLKGPVQYAVAICLLTAAAFRTPFAVIAIAVLCFGDASAALVGRGIGRLALPWNRGKVRLPMCLRRARRVCMCRFQCTCAAQKSCFSMPLREDKSALQGVSSEPALCCAEVLGVCADRRGDNCIRNV